MTQENHDNNKPMEDKKDIEKEDKDMVEKLELQLHEQYAVNNNANVSSVIALIVAVIAILGFWGYVFVYSSLDFAQDTGHFVINGQPNLFTLDVLFFISIAAIIILNVLKYICLYQGTQQRYEQFIIYAIRCKYYKKKPEETDIFPKDYTPMDKSFLKITQGLFGELIVIFTLIEVFIIIAVFYKISSILSVPMSCYLGAFIFTICGAWAIYIIKHGKKYKRYIDRKYEYKIKLKEKNSIKDIVQNSEEEPKK